MTKLDGDARGGAALSVKAVTGVPIKFVGTGEHLDALEEFHPERMAGRILGMGDVLTLVEQAQQKFDQDEMAKQEARLRKGEFTLDDFKKTAGPDEEARADQQDHEHDAGHGRNGRNAGQHRRRAGHAPPGGHHRLDDARRAPQPVAPDRSEPPPPHRRGGGRRAARSQRAGQAVRRHGRHDEADVEHGHPRPHEDHAATRQQRHAQPRRQAGQAESRHRQAADPAGEGPPAQEAGKGVAAAETRGTKRKHDVTVFAMFYTCTRRTA